MLDGADGADGADRTMPPGAGAVGAGAVLAGPLGGDGDGDGDAASNARDRGRLCAFDDRDAEAASPADAGPSGSYLSDVADGDRAGDAEGAGDPEAPGAGDPEVLGVGDPDGLADGLFASYGWPVLGSV